MTVQVHFKRFQIREHLDKSRICCSRRAAPTYIMGDIGTIIVNVRNAGWPAAGSSINAVRIIHAHACCACHRICFTTEGPITVWIATISSSESTAT